MLKEKKIQSIARNNMMWFVLIVLIVLFGSLSPNFLTLTNLRNICTQESYFIVTSIGLGLIMISGGIDFSVGQCISVVAVCVATFLQWKNFPVWAAVMLGVLIGVALGCINGILTGILQLYPMIVTIGTMTTFRGISYLISNARTYHDLPRSYMIIGQGNLGPIPIAVVITVAVALVAQLILEFTCYGRFLYAVGGNAEAARLSGINLKRVRFQIFLIGGLFYSIAAILKTSRGGSASSSIVSGIEFDAITACVMGGVSFRGGRGRVLGIVSGCLVLGVLSNGMQLLGIGNYIRYVVTGIIMVFAVAYDTWSDRRKNQKIASEQTLS